VPARPKLPSAPPADIRLAKYTKRPTSRIVGPKPRMRVARKPRPVSGASALTTTFLVWSSVVSLSVLTNAGTCVVNRVTECVLSFVSVKFVAFFSLPWIVCSWEEISATLPAAT
jgi:hypothetical protein